MADASPKAPSPAASRPGAMTFELLSAGHCVHPEHVVHTNFKLSPLVFPALFAVIHHEKHGTILWDTGYSERFFEATRRFPERLYAMVTPVTASEPQFARSQLKARGLRTDDVRMVICSHFHADHIAALHDFPKATFVYHHQGYADIKRKRGLRALIQGVLPALIPGDFEARGRPLHMEMATSLPAECAPFTHGVDLFGDGRLLAVELPGHASGQLGLFVTADNGRFFLAADACWTQQNYRDKRARPSMITRLLFDDWRAYHDTLDKLAALERGHASHAHAPAGHPSPWTIVPSHCNHAHATLVQKHLPAPSGAGSGSGPAPCAHDHGAPHEQAHAVHRSTP